ncbi:MAG: BspA family leucine-rich repeat surface protein, partial [Eubacteriales bacterium]|nr:BspA family leucine-rich repeat surface protein [Eubacteriales bacterium]
AELPDTGSSDTVDNTAGSAGKDTNASKETDPSAGSEAAGSDTSSADKAKDYIVIEQSPDVKAGNNEAVKADPEDGFSLSPEDELGDEYGIMPLGLETERIELSPMDSNWFNNNEARIITYIPNDKAVLTTESISVNKEDILKIKFARIGNGGIFTDSDGTSLNDKDLESKGPIAIIDIKGHYYPTTHTDDTKLNNTSGFAVGLVYRTENESETKDKYILRVVFNFDDKSKGNYWEVDGQSSSALFEGFTNLTDIDISKLDFSEVTDFSSFFKGDENLKSVTFPSEATNKINQSNKLQLDSMFANCSSLTSINGMNGIKPSSTRAMFYNCSSLKESGMPKINTSAATDLSAMFYGCKNLKNYDFSQFDLSSAEDISYMFAESGAKTLKLGDSPKGTLTNMYATFMKMPNVTSIDISGLDTSNVNDMSFLFYSAMNEEYPQGSQLTTITTGPGFKVNNVSQENSVNMFYNCLKLKGEGEYGASYDPSHSHAGKLYARIGKAGKPGYLSGSTAADNDTSTNPNTGSSGSEGSGSGNDSTGGSGNTSSYLPVRTPHNSGDNGNAISERTIGINGETSSSFKPAAPIVVTNEKQNAEAVYGRWVKTDKSFSFIPTAKDKPVNSWLCIKDSEQEEPRWYYFDQYSVLKTGWLQNAAGDWFYVEPRTDTAKGGMLKGWNQITGQDGMNKWYYFEPDNTVNQGALYVDGYTPDGYLLDKNGAWTGTKK